MSVNFDIWGSQVSSRPPICRICTGGDKPRIVMVQEGRGVRHWPYEGHNVPNNVPEKNKRDIPSGITGRRGRPKKWANEAERKAAYRRRHEA